ncbi:MAG: transporter associated domain-containing protein [Bacteroidota bacterium]
MIETQIDAQTFRFSARLEVDYLNEKFKLQLPTGEYETLAGLILAYTEDFPQTGDTVLIEGHSFTIEKTENKRIDVVKLAVNNPES